MRPIFQRWAVRTALSTASATTLATALGGWLTVALAPVPAHADAQTVKLIQLLIQKGILSPGQAKDLLRETGTPAPAGRRRGAAPAAAPVEAEEAPPANPAGQIRVTYVPQFVRKQIADEVRAQVMNQAQAEGWAAPDALPEWTKRIRVIGDLRMRYLGDMFDKNNYNQFVNFNSINNGSPYDANAYAHSVSGATPPPFLNTNEDRNRFRLRARFGVVADIDDWITAEVRAGTGQDDGPVSTNQTLGTATSSLGAAGDFAKPSLWLDRGFFTLKPLPQVTVYAGRMDNPFLPSDLMFYPDLAFDGLAARFSQPIGGGFSLFGTAGGFPLYNTSFDFATNSDTKFSSTDSYLAAAQAGADWRINPQLTASLAVGIFDFLGVQGSVSNPCTLESFTTNVFFCNTDSTRTPYEQFGNTLYAIRNIPVEIPTSTGQVSPDPQYYGLASRFNVLDIHPRFNILTYDPIDVALEGEFIKNLAYNRTAILAHGAPNEAPGPVNNLGNNAAYEGGDTGYMIKATIGELEMRKRWDWNTFLSYRYLQTDATLDALADSDFHEGGTNAQGYLVGGNLGIATNTWLTLRWLSAQAISGPHYGTDQVYLDLQTRF